MSVSARDPATNQLEEFRKNKGNQRDVLTTSEGCPIDDKLNSLTVGPRGPLLMQDFVYIDEIAHFDRERIPERVVHAKGTGAFGYFEVTKDITKYCKALVFSAVGKRTPIAARWSTVGGESGSADTARDPRGFAVKFYTEEGNWDLVGNNTPIFFIRDPLLFPNFIHTQKRNPATHLKDPDMFWDFITLRPETTHQVCFLFSDRGTPVGYRYLNGYGSHTFKMVNAQGEPNYVKFHYKTDQGIKCFDRHQADEMAKQDPDFSIRDMYNAIAKGEFPKYTMYIQVMSYDQARICPFNPFDLTKVWPHKDYPLIEAGRLVFNRNPKNYFAEVEQLSFSPAALVPGIEASPDKMLQGRLFSYDDTARYRLGPNYKQIPVNCPYRASVNNTQRDSVMTVDGNQDGAPNYFPNSFSGADHNKKWAQHVDTITGDVARHDSSNDDNFSQVTDFWKNVLKPAERERLVDNIASHLCNAQQFIQDRAVTNFSKVHADFGSQLKVKLEHYRKQPKKPLAHL